MISANQTKIYILAMSAVIVVSNMLVQYPLGQWLTWGALTFPFAFLITDLVTRFHGTDNAKKVIGMGLLVGIVFSFLASFFSLTTLRIAVASATAFLIAQLTDMKLFDSLRNLAWWKTPIISSTVGSVLDTFLFFGIAFSAFTFALSPDGNSWAMEAVPLLGFGPETALWISLAIADLGIKLLMVLVMLIPYRVLIRRNKQL
jgi:queuosine precursor transporter